jgi:hypothetical protein
MRQYVDEQGNIIQEPDLVDHLKERDSELGKRAENFHSKIALLKTFQRYLYAFPSESELNLREGRGPAWEHFIQSVDAQDGLAEMIGMLEDLKTDRRDLTRDKVVVVHSERPFYDTLKIAKNAKPVGKSAEGWVGILESRDLTDVDGAKFCSLDGKIHQRIVLNKARRLSVKELEEFAIAAMIRYDNHHFDEEITACLKKLEKSPIGERKVMIYDKYPNVDLVVLDHKLKDNEKAVAHISAEEAEYTDFAKWYGPRQIRGSYLEVALQFENDKGWMPMLSGEDSRSVANIYQETQRILKKDIKVLLSQRKVKKAWVFVGKQAKPNFTEEEIKKAFNAPSGDAPKWLKKYLDEKGVTIGDTTCIALYLEGKEWLKHADKLAQKLESQLGQGRYQRQLGSFSIGLMRNPEESHLSQQTTDCFRDNTRAYVGEIVVHQ